MPEDGAQGAVAEVYAEYRATTGLARTPLLLRELATHGPDVLTAVWATLRPHYAGSALHVARRRLLVELVTPPLRLAPADLVDAGADGPLLVERMRATLGMFAVANATNLIVVHLMRPDAAAARVPVPDAPEREDARPSSDLAPLPLPEPEDLAPELAEQVMRIARRIVDDPPPGWWPSLLLHLAPFPHLLAAVDREVAAHTPVLRRIAGELDARAATLASELAAGVAAELADGGSRGSRAPLGPEAQAAADELAARYLRVLPPLAALAACPVEVADAAAH